MKKRTFLKYLNQKVNFTISLFEDEYGKEKVHQFTGTFIGLNILGIRDDYDGYLTAVILPDDNKGFDYEFFNFIDIKTIKLCKQEETINIRVSNQDKIKYQNLSKSKKIPLSRLIKNLLNEELKNKINGK